MGWGNSHLFEFEGKEFAINDDPQSGFFEAKHSDEITIVEVLKQKNSKIKYTHDFCDNWEHLITVEEIVNGEFSELREGYSVISGSGNYQIEAKAPTRIMGIQIHHTEKK